MRRALHRCLALFLSLALIGGGCSSGIDASPDRARLRWAAASPADAVAAQSARSAETKFFHGVGAIPAASFLRSDTGDAEPLTPQAIACDGPGWIAHRPARAPPL